MKAFEKIFGYESEKKELIRIADILKNPEKYAKMGATTPKGLLINGKPGLGKTLLANCLIEASGLPAFVCRKDKSNGDFVNFIKETFEKAMEAAPAIVLLDDMDKFGNEDNETPNAEEYVTVQSCIDNAKNSGIFVIATSNNRRLLPHSLTRAGRFDISIDIFPPEYKDSVKIISGYLKNKPLSKEIQIEYIAKLLHRRSCAEIETIVNAAAALATFEDYDEIQLSHFVMAAAKRRRHYLFELSDIDIDLENHNHRTSEIVYHEAGHAVISELLSPESVTLITVENHAGATNTFYENAYITNELQRDICMSLAGMAAVNLKYGRKGGGTESDLTTAIQCIERLATQNNFRYIEGNGNCSENFLTVADNHRINELEHYFDKVTAALAKNREFLDKIAIELAEKKLLTMYDVQRIKNSCRSVEVMTL